MIKAGIYKITSPSNRVYIGQSWNIKKRKYKYKINKEPKQRHIYNSINKYGWEAHKFEIIHELPQDTTQEVMDNYEILYWQLYKDCGIEMMNIREPGRGGRNSEETKRKMSENNWNKKHKGALSPSYGKKHTQDHIDKAHKKGKENAMYGRFGKNHPRYGIPHPESFLEKRGRKVINTDTLEVYKSVSLAEIAFGLKPATLRHHLKNKTTKYPIQYLDEYLKN